MPKRLILLVSALLLLALLVPTVSAQTVVQRMRLGNNVEGMTFVRSGPFANHIVFLDGRSLMGFPAEGRGNAPARALFDFSQLNMTYPVPRGVAWIDSERLFVFTDATAGTPTTTFYLSDHRGQPKGTIVFPWPEDFVDSAPYTEAITWVPLDAPKYAGDLIFIGYPTASDDPATLFVITRQGELVARLPAPDYDHFPYGVSYRAPGRLVLSHDNRVWETDLDGNPTAGPVSLSDAYSIEALAALPSGRIAVTSYSSGKLVFLDKDLNRLPEERSYRAGLGLGVVSGVTWKADTTEYLVLSRALEPSPQVAAIAPDLTSYHTAVDMGAYAWALFYRVEYLPEEHHFAVFCRAPNPRGFWLFDLSGTEVDFLSVPPNIALFKDIPGTGQLILRRGANPLLLEIHDRSELGTLPFPPPLRTIDLSSLPAGTSIYDVAYFNPDHPTGGQFLALAGGTSNLLLVLDFQGTVLAQYNYVDKLHVPAMTSVGAITSGPHAGAFVGIDTDNDELIVFTLP